SNIGLYLAATAVAYKTDLISKEEALERAGGVVSALEQVEKWRGFPRPWIQVRTLKASFGDEFTYDTHMSILVGALVVTKNILPELEERIGALLSKMKFRDLYDPKTGWLKGGYNIKHDNFAFYQPWGHWYYKYFASGARLLSFYGIAKGQIPKKHWTSLIRPVRQQGEEKIFATGYEEPGLEIQFLTSLFLDERFTEMGISERNYIRYQIEHAAQIKSPVWGWASCQTKHNRYLTFGELRDAVVAPYASILAAIYFPTEAYENLQILEKLGARPFHEGRRHQGRFGFRDSVNWETKEVVNTYLTPSQGMAFLALANVLHHGAVWQSFQSDATVEKGIETLGLNIQTRPKIEQVQSDSEVSIQDIQKMLETIDEPAAPAS
ncbi:hypothetical protein N9K06_01850, partial [Omnitrophica bacterium]|nr:hypothetical protein [Candidatus Omnitrophota bacterium]